MEPINLYDIYKNVRQRERRQKSKMTQNKAKMMVMAAESIIDWPDCKPNILMKLVKKFRIVEDLWLASDDVSSNAKSMSDQFEAAIISNNYYSKRSHFDPKSENRIVDYGWVYCAKSASKPGQLKLGFTKNQLNARLKKYSNRYALHELRPLFAIWGRNPSQIEFDAKKNLTEYLVVGCRKGEGIEWYSIKAIQFARKLVESIHCNGHEVSEINIYPGTTLAKGFPNTSNVSKMLRQLGLSVDKITWHDDQI